MPIIKTYEISFWAGETLVCAMKVDGVNKKQIQRLGWDMAHNLKHHLQTHYANLGYPWKGKVKAIVNIKK